ncbi:MAG: hypothetical protein AAF449_12890, partial [Myxococcota bacterium]
MRWVVALALVGCVPVAPEGDYGDPTALQTRTTANGITARLVSPSVVQPQLLPSVRMVVEAFTADAAPLEVAIIDAEGTVYLATKGSPAMGQQFEVDIPLLHGGNPLQLRINAEDRRRVLDFNLIYVGPAPGVRFEFLPATETECIDATIEGVTARSSFCVRGRVTEGDAAIVSMAVGLDGEPATPIDLAGGFFEARRSLRPDAATEVRAVVTDEQGRTTAWVRRLVQDSTPPALMLPIRDTPWRTELNQVEIEGRVTDLNGVATVRIASQVGGQIEASVQPDGAFRRRVQLEPGVNRFDVVAEDIAGQQTRQTVEIVRERLIRLRAAEEEASIPIRLDRHALEEVLTPEAQRSVEVAVIPLRAPVQQTLAAIREPERFGLDTRTWGPAETNLATLLRMTPDNANLVGSSIEQLVAIAPAVGLPSPRLLGQLLDIEPTEPFVSLAFASEVVLEYLIGTHPGIVRDETGTPAIRLTLYDVLRDLVPVASRFGPIGSHPGFLSGESRGVVLESGFLLTVKARSNLEIREGVDASEGSKDFLYRSNGGPVLELDFLSDEASVVGLVDAPTADLRFELKEAPRFLEVGQQREVRPDPTRPGFFRGQSEAFGVDPWFVEHIVAEAAYRRYLGRFAPTFANQLRYDAGSIVDAAVFDWSRGWVTITTSGNIGRPPAPVYAWDVITEVAQRRLHEGPIPEGQANLAFRMPELSFGLTAEDLVAILRPTLHAQRDAIAERI